MTEVRQLDTESEPLTATDALGIVHSLGRRLAVAETFDDVSEAVSSGTEDVLGASGLILAVLDDSGSRLQPLAARGISAEAHRIVGDPQASVPLEPTMAAHRVISSGEPIFWSSVAERNRTYPRYGSFPTEMSSWAVLPLSASERCIGILVLGWRSPRSFDPAERALLGVVSHQCATALVRTRLLRSEREEREMAELLAEGTRLMASALDPDEIVLRLVRLAVPTLAPWCAVYAAEGDQLHRVAIEIEGGGPYLGDVQSVDTVPTDADVALAAAYRTGEVQLVADVSVELVEGVSPPEGAEEPAGASGSGKFSAVVAPVKASGRVIGVMSLVSDRWTGVPGPKVIRAVEGLAARAGVALRIARQYLREHETARLLTEALLPEPAAQLPGFETATRYLPAGDSVAGDWFDLVQVTPERYLLGIGDSAGHGIQAASLMAELRNAARGLGIAGFAPSQILGGLRWLLGVTQPDGYASALYALVESSHNTVTWASVGHLPPILFDEEGARLLSTRTAAPLGAPGRSATDHTVTLADGAGLLLFTDGIVERRRESLGSRLDRLLALVSDHRREAPEDLADRIVETLCRDREDDCCLLVVRRRGPAR